MYKKEEVPERTEMLAQFLSLSSLSLSLSPSLSFSWGKEQQKHETILIRPWKQFTSSPGNIHVPGNLSTQEQPPPRKATPPHQIKQAAQSSRARRTQDKSLPLPPPTHTGWSSLQPAVGQATG